VKAGEPVISVDAKKKELVGDFKNAGREWRPEGDPKPVRVYDFIIPGLGGVTSYGIFDMARNAGWVNVGTDHETSAFAVESIRRWWGSMGRAQYVEAKTLLITADGGGSNGSRVRLWKLELQRLASETGLPISVCHYQGLAKHYRGLMSWAMHEHVAHGISCPVVSGMFKDFFGLRVYTAEIWRFKAMMAEYYRTSYKRLLDKILSGEVLQIDETEVRLRTGTGYVWVFTTSEEVAYMYRPTREGDFLHDLLKNFHGVLVSDFYAAYDSLECPQQECLIHLMRDMNQELLGNPFDEELQSITGPFGTLLREIVATIDQHGLKRRYSKRHERGVAKYFQSVAAHTYRSEAAEAQQVRLVKCQDKLITFIKHDGVPWNNNNAENAIRRFGYYREDSVGRVKEPGLKDFLVLLSICHTYHYKGVSFLKFLLSRERDIDAFCRRPQPNQPSASSGKPCRGLMNSAATPATIAQAIR